MASIYDNSINHIMKLVHHGYKISFMTFYQTPCVQSYTHVLDAFFHNFVSNNYSIQWIMSVNYHDQYIISMSKPINTEANFNKQNPNSYKPESVQINTREHMYMVYILI